jgi:hypothetical protein
MTSEHIHHDHSQILKGMESADPAKVLESLEELRESGKVTDIPILLELLHLNRNAEIKSKIIDILANLKENESIPLIIAAIQNPKYAPELKDLIACCWENGLNFSGYLSLFVDLLIDHDFEIAFEAYTVIMNFEHRIDQRIIDQQVERLEAALPACSEMKRQLLLDVVDFLPGLGI